MTKNLPQPSRLVSTAAGKSIAMAFDHHNALPNLNSLSATLGSYFSRYRLAVYIVFAAATSLSVAWNWNWLTGDEVFSIMAPLPCTLMMLMFINAYSGCT